MTKRSVKRFGAVLTLIVWAATGFVASQLPTDNAWLAVAAIFLFLISVSAVWGWFVFSVYAFSEWYERLS